MPVASVTAARSGIGAQSNEILGHKAAMERLFGGEMGSNESIEQAVMADMGFALLSAHKIAAELEDKRLTILPLEGADRAPVVRRKKPREAPAPRPPRAVGPPDERRPQVSSPTAATAGAGLSPLPMTRACGAAHAG